MAARVFPWLGLVFRLILAGVLGVAGALKVADPTAAVAAVRAYQLLPESLLNVVGYGLPFLEIALAILLLIGLATRYAALGALVLMVVFIIGIASAWARGLSIDCGCFGGGGQVAPGTASYLPEIIRDALLGLAAAFLVWRPRTALAIDTMGATAVAGERDWAAELAAAEAAADADTGAPGGVSGDGSAATATPTATGDGADPVTSVHT